MANSITTHYQLNTPVLFIIFNRPNTTQKVFEAIRQAQPKYLFVAADGPRKEKIGESEKCEQARKIATQIDWPCEVKTLFREHNLGCKYAPSSAIAWFFEQVDEGIILEDDCLPDSSFFPFCAELLERYRDDSRVFMVSGTNDLGNWKATDYSYFFTIGNTWGWATWKRAWQHFDLELKLWTDGISQQNMQVFSQGAPYLAKEIADGCQAVLLENLDAWDYQWAYVRIACRALGVIPAMNLVSNIGFSRDATHTTSNNTPYANTPVYVMQFPLRHNPNMQVDFEYYEQCYKAIHRPIMSRIKQRLCIYYQKLRNITHRLFQI